MTEAAKVTTRAVVRAARLLEAILPPSYSDITAYIWVEMLHYGIGDLY